MNEDIQNYLLKLLKPVRCSTLSGQSKKQWNGEDQSSAIEIVPA